MASEKISIWGLNLEIMIWASKLCHWFKVITWFELFTYVIGRPLIRRYICRLCVWKHQLTWQLTKITLISIENSSVLFMEAWISGHFKHFNLHLNDVNRWYFHILCRILQKKMKLFVTTERKMSINMPWNYTAHCYRSNMMRQSIKNEMKVTLSKMNWFDEWILHIHIKNVFRVTWNKSFNPTEIRNTKRHNKCFNTTDAGTLSVFI